MDDKPTYNWPEMLRYWTVHNAERGRFNARQDPDGLNNVCHSGAPMPVNRYYDRCQRRVYLSLMSRIPTTLGARALDIGCGAARWSRLLSNHGYEVTGIDIQSDLINANARRYPSIRFHYCQIQDFEDSQPFQLVSSVTVLQHLPYDEQVRAAERIANLTDRSAYLLLLENIADRAPHVFPNTVPGWIQLFENHGFAAQAIQPYDYSPVLRVYASAVHRVQRRDRSQPADLPAPEQFGMSGRTSVPAIARRVALVCASLADSILDPMLSRLHAPLPTAHVGILFQKAE